MSLLPAESLSRRQALALVCLLWAAIYLPALGSLEIKGEEGRRLLPAVSMLAGGSWVVPQIGGVDYLSKPPLINWCAAAALRVAEVFAGHGTRSEWAARAPSVLAVLALALTMVGALSRMLTPAGALFAAVCALTNLGMMEKGRLAEIEGLYISLYGIALVLWLAAWREDGLVGEVGGTPRSPWRTWALPWVFLGLGLLTKGPLHLLFFYAVVVASCWRAGRWRGFFSVTHLVGVVVMLGIFAAWAVPYLHQTAADRAGGVWLAQFQGRLEVNEGFRFGVWLLNVPRGLINFLPWAVLLPLLWRALPDIVSNTDRALLTGGRWATLGCFLAVSLAPGGQPRYTLPLLVPACVFIALACRRGWDNVEADGTLPPALGDGWSRAAAVCLGIAGVLAPWAAALGGGGGWRWLVAVGIMLAAAAMVWRVVPWKLPPPWERVRPHRLLPLAVASASAMALLTWDYAVGVVPKLRVRESVRPAARAINRALADNPGSATLSLTVLRPGFLPFLYYLRTNPRYAQEISPVPPDRRRFHELNSPVPIDYYLLVRDDDLRLTSPEKIGGFPDKVATVTDKRVKNDWRSRWHLLHIEQNTEVLPDNAVPLSFGGE